MPITCSIWGVNELLGTWCSHFRDSCWHLKVKYTGIIHTPSVGSKNTHKHKSEQHLRQVDAIKGTSRLHMATTLSTITAKQCSHLTARAHKDKNSHAHTKTNGCLPGASGGASAAAPAEAEDLLGSSRAWIQLVAPCRKSRSSSAVSLFTMLSVLTFSTCFSVCGPLPGERDTRERKGRWCTGEETGEETQQYITMTLSVQQFQFSIEND